MTDNEYKKILKEKLDDFELPIPENGWAELEQRLPATPKRTIIPLWIKWTAAACIVICLVSAVLWKQSNNKNNVETQTTLTAEHQESDDTIQNRAVEKHEQIDTDVLERYIAQNNTNKTTKQAIVGKTVVTPIGERKIESTVSHSDIQKESVQTNTENITTTDNIKQDDSETAIATLTETEAESLLNQSDEQLRRQLESEKNTKIKTNTQPVQLGFLASLNANDRIGNQMVTQQNKISSVNQSGDGPVYLPPQTQEEMQNDLPFSLGLSVAIPIAKRWDVITGIDYSYMHSQRTTNNVSTRSSVQSDYDLHYLGIPAQISYRIINRNFINFYVSLGGKAEKGLTRVEKKSFMDENNQWVGSSDKTHTKVPGMQWSVGGNLGVSLKLYKGLSFYIEPGLTYYIPNARNPQPTSLRTDNPLFFSLSGGLRFTTR
ncbi:MAG: porin family protein [Bacteroidales bacterium]|nr:porin family protein [Bacteroidales bacterium]